MSTTPKQTLEIGAATDAVPLAEIGERFSALRLLPPRDPDMAASLKRFGQLSPVVVFRTKEGFELIDGFRRLRAAMAQGFPERLAVQCLDLDECSALAALFALHRGASRLCELEEGWVVQTLLHHHRLAQVQVAQLLRRHQSWVSRRLLLVSSLAPEVQDDVRLGLVSPTAAREVARLPRGIQRAAATAIETHGLSTRQTAQLCGALERQGITQPEEVEPLATAVPPSCPKRAAPTEAEQLQSDFLLLERVALRVQTRLRRHPALITAPVLTSLLPAVQPALFSLLWSLNEIQKKTP